MQMLSIWRTADLEGLGAHPTMYLSLLLALVFRVLAFEGKSECLHAELEGTSSLQSQGPG